jgi:hypothetical protein
MTIEGPPPGTPIRDVPVDWEALEDAFENNAPEVHSYLHVQTGEVLRVVDGIADPEMHARIAADPAYMRVDPVSSREQYRWMERFIPMVDDPELRDRLVAAIDGKGAFRRFKDVLMAYGPERERWFAFRSERLRVFMEAWLSAHGMRPVPRPVWRAEAAPTNDRATPISQEQISGRRSRSADALRKLLDTVAESLGARDLEKVVAFAEFVKARRSARGFSARHDAATAPAADAAVEAAPAEARSSPAAAAPVAEEPPSPSSRKRTASR